MNQLREAVASFDAASLTPASTALWSACAGLFAHAYFKRREPNAISYLVFATYQAVALGIFFHTYLGDILRAVLYTCGALSVFNTTLLLSIAVYRLSPWHPLARYPGPAAAKLSKLYMAQQARLGQTGYTQAALHDEYDSDVVRIGPNWVSIRSVEAIPTIYGGNANGGRTPWLKGDWYEGAIPGAKRISLHQAVDLTAHARRRKIWDQGFSARALAEYEPHIREFVDKLVDNVGMAAKGAAPGTGEVIDLGLQNNFLSFDVMGILGFGESFNMLDSWSKHFFVQTLEQSMQSMIPIFQVPWIRILLRKLLPLPKRIAAFEKQNIERFERRLAQGSTRRDLFTYLLGEDAGESPYKLTREELIADTGLIVVAGSDTTSSLLTWFWYYVIGNPAAYAKVRAEVDALSPDERSNAGTLAKLPFLNAAINETMRMQPAVPGGLTRQVPKGGVVLDGHFFPQDTTVSVPGYAIQHDARWWGKDHGVFRPERWLSDSGSGSGSGEKENNRAAYLPFTYGSRVCPGKGLALLEARIAITELLARFEFKYAPGFSPQEFEAGVRDFFTIQNKPLPVVVTARA